MHCPECGCEIDLETDICPECRSDYTEYSIVQRKIAFNRPLKSNSKNKPIKVDSSNANGYVVAEGTSIHGGKLKRGSSTSRGGNRVAGYDVNTVTRKELHKHKEEFKKEMKIKGNYQTRQEIANEILGDFLPEEYEE